MCKRGRPSYATSSIAYLPSKHFPLNKTFCSNRNFSMDSFDEKLISLETALHFKIFFGTRAENVHMVNIQNFWPLIACNKKLRQTMQTQIRLLKKQSDQIFPVPYSDNHIVNSSPENQHFIWEQKEKSVGNFRFTVNMSEPSLIAHIKYEQICRKIVFKACHQLLARTCLLTVKLLIRLCWYTVPCADPEGGGTGSPDPLWKITKYRVS